MNSNSQLTMPFLLRVRHVWVHGFLIGLLLGALGFGAYYFFWPLSSLSPLKEQVDRSSGKTLSEQVPPKAPVVSEPRQLAAPLATLQVTPQASSHPESTREQELSNILIKIKEATLKKDLVGLMNLYSPSFPGLSKKTKSITRSWKLYDYQKMDFKVHEIKVLSDNSLVTWVTWDVTVKDLAAGKLKNISKTYQISLIKESGQWHIMGLKNAFW
jgi:hypothetical protein